MPLSAIVIPAKAGIQGKDVASCTALTLGPGSPLRSVRGDDWLLKARLQAQVSAYALSLS